MFKHSILACALAALVFAFAPVGAIAEPDLAPAAPRGGAGAFDFYVLTLSWSPAFCESGEGREYRAQCEPGLGKGFVTHGLWPQYEHGFPSDCDGAASPSRMALERVAGVYPDEGLARHEWRKHGRCSGKSPSDYFADVRRARENVAIPAPFERPKEPQTFAPLDIQRAFIAANPRLRPGMLAVTCRKGALQDVRICFSRDLREFRPCPEIARSACRAGEVSVPAPL
ncbi:ribonuclease T2 [Methylosinus sp. Ce-a6]|uniref:ribonuclease T2 family protein n=1 Tax=Methylosinus sp. Ce-a6 TaxID=2172005 RepID=UPI00135A194A|nr:ribonuclease T2 [Methylosinus sp. Ce-a6]